MVIMRVVVRLMMCYWCFDGLCGAIMNGLAHDGQVEDEGTTRAEEISVVEKGSKHVPCA
jgi:hypothetical protein